MDEAYAGIAATARDLGNGVIEIPVICSAPPSPAELEAMPGRLARGHAAAILGAVAQTVEADHWPEGVSYFLFGRALRRAIGSKNLEEVLRGFNSQQ